MRKTKEIFMSFDVKEFEMTENAELTKMKEYEIFSKTRQLLSSIRIGIIDK